MAKKRVKQGYLPGMEPPRVKELDDAAKIYFDRKEERCVISKEEDEAKDQLIEKMKEHDFKRYETEDGLVVEVTEKSNVKCKKKHEEENGDGEDQDDG